MANVYTQLYVQIVFAVQHRKNLIRKQHKDKIEKYMTGIIQSRNHKLIAIYCMPDHVHILIGYDPKQNLSDLVYDIKSGSTKFIKRQLRLYTEFKWQRGYGAFSYSRSHIPNVVRYIENQEEHHAKKSFKSEYRQILKKFNVSFNDDYIFEFYD